MNILFSINHPAHVHFFRNSIEILKKRNHKIWVTARDKEMTIPLLKHYNIDFIVLSKKRRGYLNYVKEYFSHQYKLFNILRDKRIRLVLSIGGIFSCLSAWSLGIPSIEFTDTEDAWLQHFLTYPFLTILYTPSCYSSYMGKKQVRYQGYHELAYLHPNYFTPDSSVLDLLGVEKDEKYIIIRFVSWTATHDLGHSGLSLEMKRKVVDELSKYARIFITSEDPLSEHLEAYRIRIPFERIHDALYFSSYFFGESGTMASECAMLGVPAIQISGLPSGSIGTLMELEQIYSLIKVYERFNVKIIDEIIKNMNSSKFYKNLSKNNRQMIKDKIDVTKYIVDLIEGAK